jgi:hypothetical protein
MKKKRNMEHESRQWMSGLLFACLLLAGLALYFKEPIRKQVHQLASENWDKVKGKLTE